MEKWKIENGKVEKKWKMEKLKNGKLKKWKHGTNLKNGKLKNGKMENHRVP